MGGEFRQDFQDKRVTIWMSMVKKIVAIKSGDSDDFDMLYDRAGGVNSRNDYR